MDIHNFPPQGDDVYNSFNEEKAIISTSRSCDHVLRSISELQQAISGQVSESKYHKLVTHVIQTFAELEETMQGLASQDPTHTATLIAVKQVYQQFVQPIVVNTYKEMPSKADQEQILDRLDEARSHLDHIIGDLTES